MRRAAPIPESPGSTRTGVNTHPPDEPRQTKAGIIDQLYAQADAAASGRMLPFDWKQFEEACRRNRFEETFSKRMSE